MANIKLGNALICSLPHPAARPDTEVGGKPPCASTSALPPSSPRALIPFSLGKHSHFLLEKLLPFTEPSKPAPCCQKNVIFFFTGIKDNLPKCSIRGTDGGEEGKAFPEFSQEFCQDCGSGDNSIPGAAWPGRGQSSLFPHIFPPWIAGVCNPGAFAPCASQPCSGWGKRC